MHTKIKQNLYHTLLSSLSRRMFEEIPSFSSPYDTSNSGLVESSAPQYVHRYVCSFTHDTHIYTPNLIHKFTFILLFINFITLKIWKSLVKLNIKINNHTVINYIVNGLFKQSPIFLIF